MQHLIILQNGLHGHWRAMNPVKYALENMDGGLQSCDIHISTANDFLLTRDGIKACGERLVDFIENIIITASLKCKSYDTISFITHSFGGIVARYAIGILYDKKMFDTIKPLLYVSISTPHLGLLNDNEWMSKVINFSANYFTGKTGKELMMTDDEQILYVMSISGTNFAKGLNMFAKKIAYSNISGDALVSLETSTICLHKYTKRKIKDSFFEITPTDTHIFSMTKKMKYMHDQMIMTDWIRRVVDLRDHYNIHRAIIGNTTIPFLPSLCKPTFTDKKYIVMGDIIKEFNDLHDSLHLPV